MPGELLHPHRDHSTPAVSLSQRNLPRRVRSLLEGILAYSTGELDRCLHNTLHEYEVQLFRQAEQARGDGAQTTFFIALKEVRRGGVDLIPRFMVGFETALATLKDPPVKEPERGPGPKSGTLALVSDTEVDERSVMLEVTAHAEIRFSLPLFLLGQRFGVLAGRSAFDAEHLPIGPRALCRILQGAAECLDLGPEHRYILFKQFDRHLMQYLGDFYEALNNYLIGRGVLPHLTFVPLRVRPTLQPGSAAPGGTEAGASQSSIAALHVPAGPATSAYDRASHTQSEKAAHAQQAAQAAAAFLGTVEAAPAPSLVPAIPVAQPQTRWPGLPTTGPDDQLESFDALRELLDGRRNLLGKFGAKNTASSAPNSRVAPAEELQKVLDELQREPLRAVMKQGRPAARTVADLKQDLLVQLRRGAADQQASALSGEDGDTIDLIGMLFDQLNKDVVPNSTASGLLTRLQVPLLRVALGDKGFFFRQQHPARQMLNAIAESGLFWNGEDATDRAVLDKMRMLVDRASREYSGDNQLFETLLADLAQHLQTQVRKAEVSERRHVEAARGKEKLESSRLRASEAINEHLAGKRVPRFLAQLLAQSWSDVLALSILRAGENSDLYRHQIMIVDRLIANAGSKRAHGLPLLDPAEAASLRGEIEQALLQVGYHAEDAQAVAARMLASSSEDEEQDDPASRTQLAMQLKQRSRLGQDVETRHDDEAGLMLSDGDVETIDRLRKLPFGTWFEFTDANGKTTRNRMSWYSTLTSNALFVNHRGQRVGEHTLEWLAHEMGLGRVKLLTEEAHAPSLVDRAWHAIRGALGSFAARSGDAGTNS